MSQATERFIDRHRTKRFIKHADLHDQAEAKWNSLNAHWDGMTLADRVSGAINGSVGHPYRSTFVYYNHV